MKTKLIILAVILIAFAFSGAAASQAYAQGGDLQVPGANQVGQRSGFQVQIPPGDQLVLGDVYVLKAGETLNGNLIIVGGTATLEPGSIVNGEVLVIGGALAADGSILGNLSALGGNVRLSESTMIDQNVNFLGGSLEGEEQASIQGQVIGGPGQFGPLLVPGMDRLTFPGLTFPSLQARFNPLWDALWVLLQSFLWAAVAVVVALFLPNPISRVGQAAVKQPVIAGGIGCLTTAILPAVLVLLMITIICIPISVLGWAALGIAWAFGILALGTQLGQRLAELSKADWALPVSAGLGTFLVVLIVNGVGKFVPCVGWLLPLLVGSVALGATLITRFGSRSYPE